MSFGALLDSLYENVPGLVELRALPNVQRVFADPRDRDTLRTFMRTHRDVKNLYFGLSTRKDHTSGDASNLLALPTLFADLDFEHLNEGEARHRLATCPCPPSAVIHSGNGLHTYWFLREPLEVDTLARVDDAKGWLRRLGTALGADLSAAEAARILRLPRTFNFKSDPPRPVVLEQLDASRRYNLGDFDEWLPAAPDERPHTASTPLGDKVRAGDRNLALFKLARSHKLKNIPEAVSLDMLRAFNAVQCDPPHTDDEVQRANYSAYHQRDRAGYAASNDVGPKLETLSFTRPAVSLEPGQCLLEPLPGVPYSGWCQRGAIHLFSGPSGSGKTTAVLDLLLRQRRGELVLGHRGGGLSFLTVFADRGTVSNRETLERMQIDPRELPIALLPIDPNQPPLPALLAAIEACPDIPEAVFVEGADLVIEDAHKPACVAQFIGGLRRIAEHYAIAFVLSVGAPKSKPNEMHVLQRDRVYGSQAWSRLSDTVAILALDGDNTSDRRSLLVLHRNAAPESFHLVFRDGRLVEDTTPRDGASTTDAAMRMWFAEVESFTARQFRAAFPKLSGARAAETLAGYVALKVLRTKEKNDRTRYIFRRPTPPRPDHGAEWDTAEKSHSEWDTSPRLGSEAETVPKTSGMGHANDVSTCENIKDSACGASDPLIHQKTRPMSHSKNVLEAERDKNACPTYPPAREDGPPSLRDRVAAVLADGVPRKLFELAALTGADVAAVEDALRARHRFALLYRTDDGIHRWTLAPPDAVPAWVTEPEEASPDIHDPIAQRDQDDDVTQVTVTADQCADRKAFASAVLEALDEARR